MKRCVTLLLTAVLILSCGAPAFGASDSHFTGGDSQSQLQSGAITCEINGINIKMENKNGSFVPVNPYIQVTYTNNGAGQAQIFIEDNKGIPVDGGILVVEPGKTGALTFSDPVKPGQRRFYNVCSKNGETKVDGILTIRTAKQREAFADPYNVNTTIIQDSKNGSFVPQNRYVKVYYKNGAVSPSKVFIQDSQGNPLPDGKGIFKVDKGKNASIILELTAGARYHYNITTPNGATPVAGKLAIRSISRKSGKSQATEEIAETEAMTIAYNDAKKTIPKPLIERINSGPQTGENQTEDSGMDGKRNFWCISIGDQKGQYKADYTLEGREIVDVQLRKVPDSQLSDTVHFAKGVFSISDIKIDSDQSVKIAIDQKGLKPGKPDDSVTGYHFMTGETMVQGVPKIVTTVTGISPDGARAVVDIDPVTGKVLSASELAGYDQDGRTVWKAF